MIYVYQVLIQGKGRRVQKEVGLHADVRSERWESKGKEQIFQPWLRLKSDSGALPACSPGSAFSMLRRHLIAKPNSAP
jgi:hypothetical protein